MAPQRKKNIPDRVQEEAVSYAVEAADRMVPSSRSPHPGGRPRLYEGPTTRLNLLLPEDTVKLIRHMAIEEGTSPSQVVEHWARRAELDRAVARGLMDFTTGQVVDHEDVMRRLSKWD